ncbi:MAG: hypothetical protein U0P81_01530 [Holophagaceae bacterium]
MCTQTRTAWALLILRVAVGFLFTASALTQLVHAHGPVTLPRALGWGLLILQGVCGLLVMLGVWMTAACLPLLALHGWPVVQALVRGVNPAALRHELLTFCATLALMVGGGGKGALGRG